MSYREIPVKWLLGFALIMGKQMGLQQRVELSSHSIDIAVTNPDQDKRAWDHSLYRNGNVFVQGYANPIKPDVDHNPDLEDPDSVTVEEGNPINGLKSQYAKGAIDEEEFERKVDQVLNADEDEDDEREPHVSLISSSRYRDYMRQDLVSQLLTPQEQWKLIMYAVIGAIVLQFVSIIVTLYATGSF